MERLKTTKIDWNKCILCKNVKLGESLQCPAKGKQQNNSVGAGYTSFVEIVSNLTILNVFPAEVDLNDFDDGSGRSIPDILHENQAKWHKICRNKFSKLRLQRAEKKKRKSTECESVSACTSKITRRTHGTEARSKYCYFCEEPTEECVHAVSTFELDMRVRKCALLLQDQQLLAKLSSGDLIAQEAVYHKKCLIGLYNKAKRCNEKDHQHNNFLSSVVFAELLSYISDQAQNCTTVPTFTLSNLCKLFTTKMEQMGGSASCHSTRLKYKILSHFPNMTEVKQGRDILLVFKDHVSFAMQQAISCDFDEEAIILSKASKILRREINKKKFNFNGKFNANCQSESVSQTLTTFIRMVINGSSFVDNSNLAEVSQEILTISQLLQFNTKSIRSTSYSYRRENPLSIYVGLYIHAKTRKKSLIETFSELGLSISYKRVLEISTQMGNNITTKFLEDNVVCPTNLRKSLFTYAAVDNIDHNPSSTSSTSSFHGTGISLFQQPTSTEQGCVREQVFESVSQSSKLNPLPHFYASVPPFNFSKPTPPVVPEYSSNIYKTYFKQSIEQEYSWLKYSKSFEEVQHGEAYSWSAYHSRNCENNDILPAVTSLLPLFKEEAKSPAMIRHSFDVVKNAVQHLNNDQVPVIAFDQPLFALAKMLQWECPEQYGESKYVIMFGGLHIELTAFRAIGKWLDGSGWVQALTQAGVASSGKADSFLTASHITRTRRAHQITAKALYLLMSEAHSKCVEDGCTLDFQNWREKRSSESLQFKYWSITLDFELSILIFVRSVREGDFELYLAALQNLTPWFFALNHYNYARWLPIHIKDMIGLKNSHPNIYREFENGKFVLNKTARNFSSIAIDHAHEQNNKLVKGDGGAIGLTENSQELLRWMVSGPEIARLVGNFQTGIKHCNESSDIRHHEDRVSDQVRFVADVNKLKQAIEEMGNTFMEETEHLYVLDTREIIDSAAKECVTSMYATGKLQYDEFVLQRIKTNQISFYSPIKSNTHCLFNAKLKRTPSNSEVKLGILKQNCSLFSRLYISCQVRSGNLDKFFRHENQPFPPSLSAQNIIRSGNKADLLSCLRSQCPPPSSSYPKVDMMILDGPVIVNMIRPISGSTFHEYSEIFSEYVKNYTEKVKRVDIVWDVYRPGSLKQSARERRGKKSCRREVKGNVKIPKDWQSFLRVDENKTQLFQFLADAIVANVDTPNILISTKAKSLNYLNIIPSELTEILNCAHEEADTRILLHARHGSKSFEKIMIRTVDTDVVVLCVFACPKLSLSELWVAFGTGKQFCYIPIHEISRSIGPEKCQALPFFHALTGCDQTSFFNGKGKKTAWSTWSAWNDVTQSFTNIMATPTLDVLSSELSTIERFVILMYDRTSNCTNINDCRKVLFSQKGRQLENIPPTKDALVQHVKRSFYQGAICWGQCFEAIPEMPSPSQWGWILDGDKWEPKWITLPQAADVCEELLKCGCSTERGCGSRCKCLKAQLVCTALCKCGGNCQQQI